MHRRGGLTTNVVVRNCNCGSTCFHIHIVRTVQHRCGGQSTIGQEWPPGGSASTSPKPTSVLTPGSGLLLRRLGFPAVSFVSSFAMDEKATQVFTIRQYGKSAASNAFVYVSCMQDLCTAASHPMEPFLRTVLPRERRLRDDSPRPKRDFSGRRDGQINRTTPVRQMTE